MTHPFLESLRQFRQMTRPRGPVRLSQFVGPEVPFDVVARRRQALQVLDSLGPDFDYTSLEATIAKTNLKVQDTALMAEVLSLGKQMEADRKSLVGKAFGFGGAIPARVVEGFSFGLLRPSEEKLLGSRDKVIANLVGDLFSMGTLGIGTYKAFGYFTQMPKVTALAENLPARLRSVLFVGGRGGAAGAIVDAARPEGIPPEPSFIDVPAKIARFVEPFTGERLGLAVGGAVFGGALDLTVGSMIRGVSLMRENRLINRDLPDEAVGEIKEILRAARIPFGTTDDKARLVRLLLGNQGKIRLTGNVASRLAANNSRAQYVTQFIYEHPDKVFEQGAIREDPVYLASLFINNPTGVSIAQGITNPDAVIGASRILGVRMMAIRAGEQVLIARPVYTLPDIEVPASLLSRFKGAVKAENRGFRAEPIMHILPDGTKVIGKIDSGSFAQGAKITVPENLTAEKAVQEKMAIISAELRGDGTELAVSLPSRISNAQMAEISRFVDNSQIRRVILSGVDVPIVLDNPIGMQVQDRIAQILKLPDPEIPKALAKQMAQAAKTGVFEGQAAVLENGYAMRVIGRKPGGKIALKDPFTGETIVADESRVGLLPTSLDGMTTPNQLLLSRLNDAERTMLANVLKSINSGFTDKVRTIGQLEKIANTRGLYLDKLDGGGIRLYDSVGGESNLYKDLDAATKGLKEMTGPMPDLTPPEMQAVLGDVNMGMIGPPGPPPRFGERMPLPDDFDVPATYGQVPGAVRKAITPSRGLLQDIERIYNVPVGRAFLGLQEQLVHRDNFLGAWVDGALPGLPKGVQPLGRIVKQAGKGADQELITSWLLADTAARPGIVARMTSQEVTAARELERWYEAAFDAFDVERDFIKVTLTNIRRWADRYGSDANEIWRKVRPGAPPPKGVDFVADHARSGSLDIYESRAFVAAGQFVHMGANNRFMKGILEETREVLFRIPDNAVKGPLVAYLEAIRGAEFTPMNAAITASINNMLEALGMTPTKLPGFSDRLALTILGLSYLATMAFRPGLAIRNVTQLLQTTWTMFGGVDDSLMVGMGRAMTLAGRDQAILDGAISIRTGGFYAAEELAERAPESLRRMSEIGLKMYNGADHWIRAVTYWTGRTRTERAIVKFAERSVGAGREGLRKARESLIDEAGLFWFDKPVQDEFFRRLVQSPEKAAAWVGKNAADVTQYLYGRGNQVWWLRTVPGRFLGQYGTWPLWYMDFVRRTFMNAWRSGHHGQAIRFIGRLGIANAAVVGAGVAVGIDLGKWGGFSSLFFTGGPGAEVLGGIATLQRGLGESLFDPDDPFGQSRLTEGSRILQRVGRAYIPMFYAARDLDRLMTPRNPHDVATALLASNPTKRYTIQEQIDLLINLGRLSTDIEIENKHPGELTAVEQMERASRLREGAGQDLQRFFQPQPIAPQQGQPGTRPPSAAPGQPVPAPGEARPIIR